MVHMLHCLEVYGQIILHFSHALLLGQLQQALPEYRCRLMEMSVTYKFDSIREYNATFLRTRILLGQDDPTAWAVEDRRSNDRLVRKIGLNEGVKSSPSTATKSASSGICRNFNEGKCTRDQCRYSHICLNCQHNHPTNTCPKPHTTNSTSANCTPLGNQISKAE